MGYLGTKPANQITDSTLIADGTITTSDLASGLTVNFADGSASTPSITNDGDTNTGIFFPAADTIAFAEGGVESARFDSSGNLGVGTSSPTSRLHVVSTGAVPAFISSTQATSFLQMNSAGGSSGIASNSNDLVLFTSSSGTERMRIDSTGKVFFLALAASAGTNALRWSTSTGQMTYDTSSARYKDNIRDSIYGLNHVMQMRSAQFEYKDDGRSDVGFIAEEMQPIVPELVGLDKDGQADSVSYDRMVSVLVKAIQEQQAIITDLKARLEILEAK